MQPTTISVYLMARPLVVLPVTHSLIGERYKVSAWPSHVQVLYGAQLKWRHVVDGRRRQGYGHGYGNKDGRKNDLWEKTAPVARDVVETLDDDGLEMVGQKQLGMHHVGATSF